MRTGTITCMSVGDEKRGAVGCFIMGMAAFFVAVLYVFGIGPAALIARNYPATDAWLQMLYYPMLAPAQYWQPFGDALGGYLKLWTE